MIEVETKTERFRALIQREVNAAKEQGLMTEWELYEHLKSFILVRDINYLTAIKIIIESLKI